MDREQTTASGGSEATGTVASEAARRRTFAIISHPDAGKTTLTEKFLLYAGAIVEAGQVRSRGARRRATSDYLAMEQQRGISITSTVLQFSYRGVVCNLLDTPGHRDFSEDTYRVLSAADAAVMVLDTAKGIEPQTRKLFEVARARHLPVLTFLNKFDRPGREVLELLDEIEEQIGLRPTPVTWPVGVAGDLQGVVDRRSGDLIRFLRTTGGATEAPEEVVAPERAAEVGPAWDRAQEELGLLEAVGADLDVPSFLAGTTTPLFVGSALTNFGVRLLLDGLIDLAPGATPRLDADGELRPVEAPFAGQVFKVQANMDRAHRDRVAFVRVSSGRFRRGATLVHEPSGKRVTTKHAATVFGAERETVEEAFPGDVVALVNATGLRVGDTLHEGKPVRFPPIPAFAPETFATVRVSDTARSKQFGRGLLQLDEEGVVQVLRDPDGLDPTILVAAVGPLQFEVFRHRMDEEFGAPVEMLPTPHVLARRTDKDSLVELRRQHGVRVLTRADGTLLALFESPYNLVRLERDKPGLTLDAIIATS
ncbi:MAG: Peptide chain release factor 3 [uncultured Acidimicrobiales bacterium]|uniref:Peptide chain release factor 3 n=1 Tax=uncultured Acidimicrobiales bacterium TaxID=310071 RepID=A0A6J4HAM4_9ACTN|nr:MAG: Peptide chain release factor 3 [uncultured Acidimicrobiales bacterium]